MTLQGAIKMLEKRYKEAIGSDIIRNPLAWALYQTWKEAERQSLKEAKR